MSRILSASAASEATRFLSVQIRTLLVQLTQRPLREAGIIPWSSPIPVFGQFGDCEIATVGLNPSNREFVDEQGNELADSERRFHTLRSLALRQWADVDYRHLMMIAQSCCRYFEANPYDTWFRALDRVIAGTGASFYSGNACHLDLVPYATGQKWTALSVVQRSNLLRKTGSVLPALLNSSPIRILILNGSTVVKTLEAGIDTSLQAFEMPAWKLPRASGDPVRGVAFSGVATSLFGVRLRRAVHIIGYNHNIQSSFGVTREVRESICDWIGDQAVERLARVA